MSEERGIRKALKRERQREKARRGMRVGSRSVFAILKQLGKRAAKKGL